MTSSYDIMKVRRTQDGWVSCVSVNVSELEDAIAAYISGSRCMVFGKAYDPFDKESLDEAARHYAHTVLSSLDNLMTIDEVS